MPTLCPTYHVPVLLSETVDGLNVRPDGTYVDATFGGGGHSREILRRLGAKGRLYGFDQDADARNNVPEDERFTFVAANFRFLPNWMRYYDETEGVDGVLADLGVSSHHFDDETRGFSFRFDAPLDMRMNTRGGNTAADVLNTYEEEQLARIFQLFGELKMRGGWLRPSSRRGAPNRWRRSPICWRVSIHSCRKNARKRIWPRCSRRCASR